MREIVDLIKELVRFRSMHSHPDEIQRCALYIQDYLKIHGIDYRRIDHNGVPSILVLPTEDYAPVLFMSHIDVVDAPDELFEPKETDGVLYGRGTLDDKYAVALTLVLAKEFMNHLRSQGKAQKDLPFGLLITGDEEIGGWNGAKHVLEQIRADFGIALDGGNVKHMINKEKGILRLRMVAKGKTAHGSRPWLGENAIEKLIQDYGVVKSYFSDSTPDHWHRTVNLGIITGGGKSVNQVPDTAEAVLDIRYTEMDDVDQLVADIRQNVSCDVLVEGVEPIFVGGESPYIQQLLDIAKDTKLSFEHGASDARFLSRHGISGIVWGADGDSSAHAMDEHVYIDSLEVLYRIFWKFFKDFQPDNVS